VLTGTSKVALTIPRDRAGTFDPKLIAKYQRRFPDFDAKIISMSARGLTVREIQGHLEELYFDVSPDLISAVTDAGGGRRMAEPATAPRGARQAIQSTGTSYPEHGPHRTLQILLIRLRLGMVFRNRTHGVVTSLLAPGVG